MSVTAAITAATTAVQVYKALAKFIRELKSAHAEAKTEAEKQALQLEIEHYEMERLRFDAAVARVAEYELEHGIKEGGKSNVPLHRQDWATVEPYNGLSGC